MTKYVSKYSDCIKRLNSLQSNANVVAALKLSRDQMNKKSIPEMQSLLSRIGYSKDNLDGLNAIHISGTKGKGSTSAFIESILRHKGLRTGMFTSPHLIFVRERIRIQGLPIDENLFTRYFEEIWNKLQFTNEAGFPQMPSYFRFLTILAFHIFLQEQVDVSVIEVGIGGTYDSTNVLERPIVCGITSLGYDHQNILGNTISDIAKHKAGIIKKNIPTFTVPQPENSLDIIREKASAEYSELTVCEEVPLGIELGIKGDHQRLNAGLAVEISKSFLSNRFKENISSPLKEKFVINGLSATSWPGRSQIVETTKCKYYLDGAHTVESIQKCINWVNPCTPHSLIFYYSGERDYARLLEPIIKYAKEVSNFEKIVFSSPKIKDLTFHDCDNLSLDDSAVVSKLETLKAYWNTRLPNSNVFVTDSVEEALNLADKTCFSHN
ncbi:FolC bifunctional protein [Rozella allomycis CSF55]|uniref:tetrahydrofolate synthase n=1 Tax=Rozella allomycis (strain CSF55) TaxID=988480 RepID=A0A075B4V3_ROZAC|nr:Mur ligase, central domain-containing protein [Rozella allomycis CSF55]RKP19815.1 FolC bifunctional protein [Rozella allomycis CSF55]|eukprot:EPZ36661.1 Mur ligase, central domain-containing protein [Rozella allomycis CSF55]